MLLEPVSFWLDRALVGPSRAEDLRDLRRRLAKPLSLGPQLQALQKSALLLRQLRERLSVALGRVTACSQCVRPRSARWPGGHCCSGTTKSLFCDEELVALKLAGTRRIHLRPARTKQNGCAFRGPDGCTLKPAHRPTLCVRYTCRELEAELARRGDHVKIATLQRELKEAYDDFCRQLGAVRDWELDVPPDIRTRCGS